MASGCRDHGAGSARGAVSNGRRGEDDSPCGRKGMQLGEMQLSARLKKARAPRGWPPETHGWPH